MKEKMKIIKSNICNSNKTHELTLAIGYYTSKNPYPLLFKA